MSHAFDRACPVHKVLIGGTGCPECGTVLVRSGDTYVQGSPHGSTHVGEECPDDCPARQPDEVTGETT